MQVGIKIKWKVDPKEQPIRNPSPQSWNDATTTQQV
jgi:hypothetical protein